MTYRPAPVPPGAASAPAIGARLEPDAIGVAQDEPASQRWALAGVVAAGVIVMGNARFALRSVFFQTPRESASREP